MKFKIWAMIIHCCIQGSSRILMTEPSIFGGSFDEFNDKKSISQARNPFNFLYLR